MTVDFRRRPSTLLPLTISNSPLSTWRPSSVWDLPFPKTGSGRPTSTPSSKWLTKDVLSAATKKYSLPQELLRPFYITAINSILCTSITVWFGAATKQDRNRLQLTSLQIPYTLDTIFFYSAPPAGATEPCIPKPPDTGAVSFLLPPAP